MSFMDVLFLDRAQSVPKTFLGIMLVLHVCKFIHSALLKSIHEWKKLKLVPLNFSKNHSTLKFIISLRNFYYATKKVQLFHFYFGTTLLSKNAVHPQKV